MTPKEILTECSKDNTYDCDYLPEDIFKAMEQYAEQQADFTYRLFIKPLNVLNQLTKVWQEETKQPHMFPDMTEFCEWIVQKVNSKVEVLCKCKHPMPEKSEYTFRTYCTKCGNYIRKN